MRTRNSAAAKHSGGYYQHCPNMDKETDDPSYPLACSSLLPANNPHIGVNQSARGPALEPMSRFRYIRGHMSTACTKVYALGIHKTHPYNGVNQGPISWAGPVANPYKTDQWTRHNIGPTSMRQRVAATSTLPSLPSVLLNARKTRTTGATATCNDTQAFAQTSRSSRYRSWDLALREPALRCSIPACPTQTNCGDTAAVKSSYLSAQRHRDANTTGVSTCLDPLRGLTCCCCCSSSNPQQCLIQHDIRATKGGGENQLPHAAMGT
jgi:hypothetical protein